jgi:hypothetical protein
VTVAETQQDDTDAPQVRHTEHEAQANLLAVLRLCAMGTLRWSEKTRRPGAATVEAVADVLGSGDFYPHEAAPPSPGRCCSRRTASPRSPTAGWG